MSTPAPTTFVLLAQPRAWTPAEAWIARGLASRAGAELVTQVEQASVVGHCRCGCSSVQLTTQAPSLTPAWCATRSPRGREDYLGVSATAGRADGTAVTVTLHVIQGTVAELELFDPQLGEGHPVDATSVVALDDLDLV